MVISDRRRAFINEYTLDHNATKAAIRAGYSPKGAHTTGWRLLQNAEVRAAINEREENLADELGITKQYLLDRQREILNMATEGVVVAVTDDGEEIRKPNLHAANKATETLMKHRGMLNDRVDATVAHTVYTLAIDTELNPQGDEADEDDDD